MSYRCPLGTYQGPSMDVERIKRDGWANDGILVINIDDWRLLKDEREFLKKIGDRIYRGQND